MIALICHMPFKKLLDTALARFVYFILPKNLYKRFFIGKLLYIFYHIHIIRFKSPENTKCVETNGFSNYYLKDLICTVLVL